MRLYKKIVFLATILIFGFVGIVFAQLDETVLLEKSYLNYQCFICYDITQDTVDLEHEMYDAITVDTTELVHVVDPDHGDIMDVYSGALEYSVYTDFLPSRVLKNSADGLVDSKYRGETIFLYDEYFVKEWDAEDGILKLAKGSTKLIDNKAFGGDFEAGDGVYQFKINRTILSGDQVVGIVIDVRTPEIEIQVVAQESLNALVGDVEIYAQNVAYAGDFVQADLILYDVSTQILLEDGEKLDDFSIDFDTVDLGCLVDLGDGATGDCGGGATWAPTESIDVQNRLQDYNAADPMYGDESMLKEIALIYKRDKTLSPGESISFPLDLSTFTYKGNGIYNLEIFKPDGESCSDNSECQSNYCVHGICRATDPYCDDSYCDFGEDHSSCPEDCEEPPECINDEDCLDAEYCLSEECVEVTGTCGYAENHGWVNYECCSDSDCNPGELCTFNECVKEPECESVGCMPSSWSDCDCEEGEVIGVQAGSCVDNCEEELEFEQSCECEVEPIQEQLDAEDAIEEAEDAIEAAKEEGKDVSEAEEKLEQAQEFYEAGQYGVAEELAKEAYVLATEPEEPWCLGLILVMVSLVMVLQKFPRN